MATIVLLHAHPDDESILTGGTIAKAVDDGHRVVIVFATGGEHGEVPDDLATGETLADRRRAEADASAQVLGAQRVVWLGYVDSGMTGWEQNTADDAFAAAPLDEAAVRLAAILVDEAADVLITYDWHGNYGHPDHIAAYRVGHRAAQLAGTKRVLEATVNRDQMARLAKLMPAEPGDEVFDPHAPMDDGNPMGMPEAEIAWVNDVAGDTARKRASISSHRSQVSDSSFFTQMDEQAFAHAFGQEWFLEPGRSGPPQPLTLP
ncbi:MAG TPA: PIG-L family deacetylase [Ilumatobacteraceae bacterium]|nr:PIG-L family deacetylase [Ilumatobacteraceae bacterium]